MEPFSFITSIDQIPSSSALFFTADWCGKCKKLLQQIGDKSKFERFFSVDIDASKELAQKYGIDAVPSLVLVFNGAPLRKIVAPTVDLMKEMSAAMLAENAKLNRVTETLTCSPQPSMAQLSAVEKIGFKSVINLRNSAEEGFIASEAEFLDDSVQYHAVELAPHPSKNTAEQIRAVLKKLEEVPRPTLLHCRRGFQAGTLALLSEALNSDSATFEDYLQWCQDCGHHLPAIPAYYELITRVFKEEKQT